MGWKEGGVDTGGGGKNSQKCAVCYFNLFDIVSVKYH